MTDRDDRSDTAHEILQAVTTAARDVLAMEAVYALGSLAHGGFAPLVSDVDVAVVVSGIHGDSPGLIERVGQIARRQCPSPLAQRLSIFWSDWDGVRQGRGRGRLPEVDRLDLIESGLLLAGTDLRAGATRPTGQMLVKESAALASSKFDDRYLADMRDTGALVAAGPRAVTKAVLLPVRFLFTLRTSGIGHNDVAAEWYAQHGRHPELAAAAMEWRRGGTMRTAEAKKLLDEHLVGIYDEFFTTYIEALSATGDESLARALGARRHALLGLAQRK